MTERRKSSRAPLLTQVEAQGQQLTALGRARDISVGGMMVETPDTLPEGAGAIVRFFLPKERRPIEVPVQVARSEPGRLMALTFLGLSAEDEKRILAYVETLEPAAAFSMRARTPGRPRSLVRRSARVDRTVPVLLSWKEDGGRTCQEAGEAVNLSREGCLLVSFCHLSPGTLLRLTVTETGRETMAHVVRTAAVRLPGRIGLGLEFVNGADLWGLEFPPDRLPTPAGPRISRRRSARLVRKLDVFLDWVGAVGQVVREAGRTREVSQHGAAVEFGRLLGVKQHCRLRVPLLEREAESQVVWARPGHPGGALLGLEFFGTEEFWGSVFPPDPGVPVA